MTDFNVTYPKIRLIDSSPIEYEGARYLLLRDPLELTDKTLLIPQPIVPLLVLCDGTRSPSILRSVLAMRYGTFLSVQRIEETLRALDDAMLLENERSQQARSKAQTVFRQERFRKPASAGASYPEDPRELEAYLQKYLDQVNGGARLSGGSVRGIVSPHIDYERGGPVYARVWTQARAAAHSADLVVIFGTDHFSEGFPVSLTRQNYATPYGPLPTDTRVVDALASALGNDRAFAGELHHRREHSIELAVVWLHHIRDKKPVPLVPILTGSISSDHHGQVFETLLAALRQATSGKRVLIVAAGDLAHVGPAFDTEPYDPGKLVLLKDADDELIQAMCSGSAENFLASIQRVEDRNNVCGVTPIYLTLRMLAPLQGQSHGYAACPADQKQTSFVTICGVTLQ